MSYITPPPVRDGIPLDLQVAVDEEDNSVYIRLVGFDNQEDAAEYAHFLSESLPLILFESDVKH